jgi:Cu2+-exporting ATPase
MVRRCDSDGGVARLTLVKAPEVRAGDRLVVAPGDCVPVDAVLLDAQGSFSTDWITGEPDVHSVAAGAAVLAGSWNAGRSAVTLLARTSFQESPLPSLLRAPSPAAAAGVVPAHARFFDRYARVYVAVVFAVAAGGALLWSLLDPGRAIDVTVAILVVTCPCAVGLAAPLAVELVAGQLRRRGLFIKSPDLLDRLPRVRKLLFDKTGTLTLGRLELASGDQPRHLPVELRDAAFDMVARSNHPVSRCLAAALTRAGARFDSAAVVVEEPGAGLELSRDGHTYRLGTPAWTGVAAPIDAAVDAPTTVLCRDGIPVAAFATTEQIRPDARRELAALSAAGYALWLISGDSQARVSRFAASIGIPPEHALGGQRPESKARLVQSLDAGDTLYLGDGVNDSLAFDSALVAGTTAIDRPAVPGRADFFLLGEGTEAIRSALVLATRLRAILRRNLAIAGVYNALAVTACLLGWMTPLRAALAMPASSLLLLFLTTRALSDRSVAAARAPEAAAPLAPPRLREVA